MTDPTASPNSPYVDAASALPEERRRPALLFIATEDWFFASHFRGFADAARRAGFDPVVAARVGERGEPLAGSDLAVFPVSVDRRARGPFALLRAVRAYRGAILRARPTVVHCIALQSILIGGLAARLERVPFLVLAPTGLGAAWVATGLRARLIRAALRLGVRSVAAGRRVRFLFENRDDPISLGLSDTSIREATFVAGAGVDADLFPVQPMPAAEGPLRVAVVARMVASKGIADAVEAVRLVRAAGHDIVLDLWGAPDPENPTSCTMEELSAYARTDGVTWCGPTRDVAGVWRNAHVAMLLSRGGEGLPRSLVEAAASARPIVTTDVPGCRDCVEDGREGFRVPPQEPQAAADALARLAADPDLRVRCAAAARRRFERDMCATVVEARVSELYRAINASVGRGA